MKHGGQRKLIIRVRRYSTRFTLGVRTHSNMAHASKGFGPGGPPVTATFECEAWTVVPLCPYVAREFREIYRYRHGNLKPMYLGCWAPFYFIAMLALVSPFVGNSTRKASPRDNEGRRGGGSVGVRGAKYSPGLEGAGSDLLHIGSQNTTSSPPPYIRWPPISVRYFKTHCGRGRRVNLIPVRVGNERACVLLSSDGVYTTPLLFHSSDPLKEAYC